MAVVFVSVRLDNSEIARLGKEGTRRRVRKMLADKLAQEITSQVSLPDELSADPVGGRHVSKTFNVIEPQHVRQIVDILNRLEAAEEGMNNADLCEIAVSLKAILVDPLSDVSHEALDRHYQTRQQMLREYGQRMEGVSELDAKIRAEAARLAPLERKWMQVLTLINEIDAQELAADAPAAAVQASSSES